MATNSIFYQQRSSMLKKLLALGAVITFVLAMLNVFAGTPEIGWVQLIASLISTVILYNYKSWVTVKNLQAVSIFFATVLLSLILYSVNVPNGHKLVFLWVFTIPLIAYNTTGVFYGFILTAVFLSACIISIWHVESFTLPLLNITHGDALICLFTVWVLTHFSEQINRTSTKKLTHLATVDPLTNLFNRYALQEIFNKEKHQIISMVILDIDYFKKINDAFGHDGGDYVLIKVSNMLKKMTPDTASVFRLGGEEFGILLPNIHLDKAKELANQVLTELRNSEINYNGKKIHITASAGVSNSKLKRELGELMKAADKCLYKAKQTGRDKALGC